MQSTRAHLPAADAKIVFAKVHVVKHLHEAIDRVRRGEHRALRHEGDERLTGFKYLWLRRPTELPPEQRLVLRALPQEDFKVARLQGAERDRPVPVGRGAALATRRRR